MQFCEDPILRYSGKFLLGGHVQENGQGPKKYTMANMSLWSLQAAFVISLLIGYLPRVYKISNFDISLTNQQVNYVMIITIMTKRKNK